MNEPDQLRIDTGQGIDIVVDIAGVGARSFAFIVDWHIRVLLAAAWPLAFYAAIWAGVALEIDSPSVAWIAFSPAAAVYLLYHPIVETWNGGHTPGKRMAGIRVVGADGRDAGAGRHLLRNVFRLLDGLPAFYCLGIACCLFDRHQRRIGDFAADTLLVYETAKAQDILRTAEFKGELVPADVDRIALLRELAARWSAMEPDHRRALARRALRADADTNAGDDVLLQRLRDAIARHE
ncbi:MAG: RDD family protein [Gammaproteobacteria bacterium]